MDLLVLIEILRLSGPDKLRERKVSSNENFVSRHLHYL